MSARSLRIWSLFAPSLLVALVTLHETNAMIYTAGQILLGLWITTVGALVVPEGGLTGTDVSRFVEKWIGVFSIAFNAYGLVEVLE